MKKIFILIIGIIALISADVYCMNIDTMMSVLEKSKDGIASVFASIDKELSIAAKKLSGVDLKGEEARAIVGKLCKGRPYVIDCAIVDAAGKMLVVEPEEYRRYEGADIGKQTHIVALHQNKKPVLSDVFHSVEGVAIIDFGYPIFSDNGTFLGSVNMLVRQEALSRDIIMPFTEDMPCKAWIMQKDGLIIFDPDPNQIGRNIFTDELFRSFGVLVSFSKTVTLAEDGAGSYDFYARGLEDKTVVKKYAVWDTVSFYGTQWRIIVMETDKPASAAAEKTTK